MSRQIPPKASVSLSPQEQEAFGNIDICREKASSGSGEEAQKPVCPGKLLFTEYRNQACALLMKDNRLTAATFLSENKSKVGAIYIGKIRKIVKNLNACFVEIADKEMCFLPMDKALFPYLLNRKSSGAAEPGNVRLQEGDELLVQVERDAQKTKQASVTAHISLAGDYFAFAIGSAKVGFSSKLTPGDKKRISGMLKEAGIVKHDSLVQDTISSKDNSASPALSAPPSTGLIVRTRASEIQNRDTLAASFYDTAAQYVRLLNAALYRSCFSCLKEAPSAAAAVLEQLAGREEYQEIVTDNEALYSELSLLTSCVRFYQDSLFPLPKLYSVESRMEEALGQRVWLKSGGYLIIEPTEALTVIDVNSGKFIAGKEHKEACHRTNLEAAEEIARQLRLRNLSGIILVDFINMESEEEQRQLIDFLRKLVKSDRLKTTVVDITPLGLVEITRKKVNKPLLEQWRALTKASAR